MGFLLEWFNPLKVWKTLSHERDFQTTVAIIAFPISEQMDKHQQVFVLERPDYPDCQVFSRSLRRRIYQCYDIFRQ